MFPVENIRAVCRERGTTLAEVERALGIGNGVIARWEKQKSSPPIDRIIAIAEYLNVPVARLTGEEKKPASNGDELLELLEAYREREEIRMLFKVTKKATPNDIRKTVAIIEALINNE